MRNVFLPLFGLLLLLLTACGDGPHRFEDATWAYADSIAFDQTVQDTSLAYRLRLTLTVNDDYRYRNLYVRFRTQAPGGGAQQSLAQLVFSDSLGNWQADRSWGGTYRFETVLNDSARFPAAGTYRFQLTQFMREDSLRGVVAVGLRIEPVR